MRYHIYLLAILVFCCQSPGTPDDSWSEDFEKQQISRRPRVEVAYTDASRTAYHISAENYDLVGQLELPHKLLNRHENKDWLWMEMEDVNGRVFSTQNNPEPSRINLYRRGPYFCEIHWLDIQLVATDGANSGLRGDLALYCYPEKILADVNWHGTRLFEAVKLQVRGIAPVSFNCMPFVDSMQQRFAFPLFGEEPPLSNDSFELIEGLVPFRYDARKGYYVVGTRTSGSFQKEFYETPNKYETAVFRIKNDEKPRKIYICHESVEGGQIVEGGIVLNERGHPLPIVVQVSKNFNGEKEEKFFNPGDTAFSETFFPLYLEPGESQVLTSLHLYQNWGRHMTKHWSSLGAWMDYFHSSTGVTETTCYVPFKFAGLGGVAIADFRAMSQEAFWSGQPQHDNLAGHSFMSYYDGKEWQHSVYQGTEYRSTGPNWFDIGLKYISSDSCIALHVDIWETPQADELRSFFKAKYEVLKPIFIDGAQAHFRFLTITSAIQRLHFTKFAANGVDEIEIDYGKSPFPILGIKLPQENAFIAEYGDYEMNRGSNAVIIRNFRAPKGVGLTVGMQTGPDLNRARFDKAADTRLFLAPGNDRLQLEKGDVIEIDGFWLPYGPIDHAGNPKREVKRYGNGSPGIVAIEKGKKVSDLPVHVQAIDNEAHFTMQGGKDYIPVIITGLKTFEYPRIRQRENDGWRLLSHARNSNLDGYQVFVDDEGLFGAAFLVHSDQEIQELKVSVGKEVSDMRKIELTTTRGSRFIVANSRDEIIKILYPDISEDRFTWQHSEGNSIWFEEEEKGWLRGGRVAPNEEDIDLEYWWQNLEEGLVHAPPLFTLDLQGSPFEDPEFERTWILTDSGWIKFTNGDHSENLGVIAVTSKMKDEVLAMAWHNAGNIVCASKSEIGIQLQPRSYPENKRYHVRGKVYLFSGDLNALNHRVSRELALDPIK